MRPGWGNPSLSEVLNGLIQMSLPVLQCPHEVTREEGYHAEVPQSTDAVSVIVKVTAGPVS